MGKTKKTTEKKRNKNISSTQNMFEKFTEKFLDKVAKTREGSLLLAGFLGGIFACLIFITRGKMIWWIETAILLPFPFLIALLIMRGRGNR